MAIKPKNNTLTKEQDQLARNILAAVSRVERHHRAAAEAAGYARTKLYELLGDDPKLSILRGYGNDPTEQS